MKRLLPIVLLVMLFLSACSQVSASFVPLPDAERTAFTALVVALVAWVFALIGNYVPWSVPFLEKYKMEISLALSGALIGWIENLLPSAYPEISVLVVQLILAIFAAYGLIKFLHQKTPIKLNSLRP